MRAIRVEIYQQGTQWVARSANLNITFVASSREDVTTAVRAALRECVAATAEINLVETRRKSPLEAQPRAGRAVRTGAPRGTD